MEGLGIEKGPADFEALVSHSGLTEREADSVRSLALGMTASEASKLMGVSASTVGSYRIRAYAKLGVTTMAEFKRLPEVARWIGASRSVALAGNDDTAEATAYNQSGFDVSAGDEAASEPETSGSSANAEPALAPANVAHAPLSTALCRRDKETGGLGRPHRVTTRNRVRLSAIVCVAGLTIVLGALILARSLMPDSQHRDYLDTPFASLSVNGGVVPDVTGMRADKAAQLVAEAGYCPVFYPEDSRVRSGTVLDTEVHDGETSDDEVISSFVWKDGTTAGYNPRGDWKGFVKLSVSK